MSHSPRTPKSSEEEPVALPPFLDAHSPPTRRSPPPEPKRQRVEAGKSSLDKSEPTPVLSLVALADSKLEAVCGACGACNALTNVVGDLRRAEARISYLMDRVESLDQGYNSLLSQNRELTKQVLSQQTQTARANAPSAGAGGQELADRLRTMEQRQDTQTLATNVLEDHLMDLNARHTNLRIRVADLEDEMPAVNMAAVEEHEVNDEGESSEGHSAVSDVAPVDLNY